jgi:hypothetical protein
MQGPARQRPPFIGRAFLSCRLHMLYRLQRYVCIPGRSKSYTSKRMWMTRPDSATSATICRSNGSIPIPCSDSRQVTTGFRSACDTVMGLTKSRTAFSRYTQTHWSFCKTGWLPFWFDRPSTHYTRLVLDALVRSAPKLPWLSEMLAAANEKLRPAVIARYLAKLTHIYSSNGKPYHHCYVLGWA